MSLFFRVHWGPPLSKSADVQKHRCAPSSKCTHPSPKTTLGSTIPKALRGGEGNFLGHSPPGGFVTNPGYQPWKVIKCLTFLSVKAVPGLNGVKQVLVTFVFSCLSFGIFLITNLSTPIAPFGVISLKQPSMDITSGNKIYHKIVASSDSFGYSV